MTAIDLLPGEHAHARTAPHQAVGGGLAECWSTHLCQALARGWFRGPVDAVRAEEGGAMPATQVAKCLRAEPGDSVAAAASRNEVTVHDLHRAATCGTECQPGPTPLADRTRMAVAAGSTAVVRLTSAPTLEVPAGDECDDAGPANPPAGRSAPCDEPRLNVHVEAHADGLHVWVGAPVHSAAAASMLRTALLGRHPEAFAAIRTLVVNGQEQALTRRASAGIEGDPPWT